MVGRIMLFPQLSISSFLRSVNILPNMVKLRVWRWEDYPELSGRLNVVIRAPIRGIQSVGKQEKFEDAMWLAGFRKEAGTISHGMQEVSEDGSDEEMDSPLEPPGV